MSDQERDPVAWAQMQDAGRVGGVAAANDRDIMAEGADAALEDYLASIPGKRAEQTAAHVPRVRGCSTGGIVMEYEVEYSRAHPKGRVVCELCLKWVPWPSYSLHVSDCWRRMPRPLGGSSGD